MLAATSLEGGGFGGEYRVVPGQGIDGMAPDDGEKLLGELCDHAFRDRYISQHRHRIHDLVIWDNRATMHRATPFDDQRYRRELVRVTTLDIDEPGSRAKAA